MRIKLNGNPTMASEPTMGRKTLDGMLLSNLSHFGEEPLLESPIEDFSPAMNDSIAAFESLPEEGLVQPEATQISCWQVAEDLEASFQEFETYPNCEATFAPQSEETTDAQTVVSEYPEWVDQLAESDFAPTDRIELDESNFDSPFLQPYQNGAAFSSEVFRSERGTIEFVQHESGTYVRPTYNKCGMLVRVDFNGMSLFKKSSDALWQMVDENEREIAPSQIKTVYFERNGDLVSQTVNGTKVVILNNGSLTTA